MSATPAAPPAAVPEQIPMQGRSAEEPWRCASCGKKLAETQGYGTQIRCRCGTMNEGLEPLAREQAASVVNVTSPPVSIVIEAGAIVSPPVSVDARTTFERGAIESPVSVNVAPAEPPQVTVNPAVVSDERLDGLDERMRSLRDAGVDIAERVIELQDTERAIQVRLAEPPKPRLVVPLRDETGRIVSATVEEIA